MPQDPRETCPLQHFSQINNLDEDSEEDDESNIQIIGIWHGKATILHNRINF